MTDTKKRMPLYLEIEEDIKYKIINEEWKIGDKLLSEEEYCTLYNVSRITIRRAIKDLEAEGYLIRKSGKGTFVSDWKELDSKKMFSVTSFTEEMKERGKKVLTLDCEVEVDYADANLSKILSIDVGDKIIRLKRVRAIDEKDIIAYSVNTFPYREGFSTDSSTYMDSFYEYLKGFGIYFNYNKEYLEAVNVTTEIANKMKISKYEAVLKSTKLCKNLETNFSEYNICYFNGKKYRYYVK